MNKLPIVAHTIFFRNNQILLARRHATGFEDGNFGLPGGHLESGETVTQAAKREIWEEIGITVDEAHLTIIGVTHFKTISAKEGIDYFLSVDQWKEEPFAKAECDHLMWSDPNNLPTNTIPFVTRAVQHHFLSGEWFDEIGWDAATLKYA